MKTADQFFLLLGWFGMAGFVVCHVCLSLGYLQVDLLYQTLQIISAGALGISAFWKRFWPNVGLEIFWISVSLLSIYLYLRS